jgi:putative ABC transport system permease protein
MGNAGFECQITVEGRPDIGRGDLPPAFIRVVSDDYFQTMGIPLIRGRLFNAADSIGEIGRNRTVLISQTMADRCWPNQDPIGRRFKPFAQSHWMEVVGVVGDVRYAETDRQATIDVYYPERLYPQPHITLVVHTANDPISLTGAVRKVVRQADSDAYISDIKTMDTVVAESQAVRRYFLWLLTVLAAIGGMLATVGVFLTTAYSVAQRRRELVIRASCGATPFRIVRAVLGRVFFFVLAGLLAGAIASVAIVPQVNWLRQESRAHLSLALALAPLALSLAALLSGLVVAIHATRNLNLQRS